MTQKEQIIELLIPEYRFSPWVCGTEFMKNYIPEYRSRINELRREGYIIETQRCNLHQHKGNLQMWTVVGRYQTSKLAPRTPVAPKNDISPIQPRLIAYNSINEL